MPKATFNPATREGEHVILVRHTAVVGTAFSGEAVLFDQPKPMRRVMIGKPERCAQYSVSVGVYFTPPGKRNGSSYRALPDNITYFTIGRSSPPPVSGSPRTGATAVTRWSPEIPRRAGATSRRQS